MLVVVAALLARSAQLYALSWLLDQAIAFSAIIMAIVFQPELRRLVTRIGGILPSHTLTNQARVADQLFEGLVQLSEKRTGALLVIERSDKLDNFIASNPFDCELTARALWAVFWKDAPMHDGAVILREGRIAAAGVVLPLTQNFEYRSLSGTRHRAGIGISEDTDAVALLVSEETGEISVADKGKLTRNITRDDLELILSRLFGARLKRGTEL